MPGTAQLLDARGRPLASPASAPVPPRTIRARIDAAQITDENRNHWRNADLLGPNAELDPAVRRRLRSHARYEYANNTYCAGMIRTLANDLIGTGPALQIVGLDKDLAAQIEDAFWTWALSIRLPQKLRTMREAKVRDGEAFGSLFTNPRSRTRVQLDLQLHEAEMISSPTLNFTDADLNDGLVLDDFGNVIAYTLLDEHPGESGSLATGGYESVPAADMLHLFNQNRPGQVRGCPEISQALPLFAQLRRYTLAVIRCAEQAALMTWVVETGANVDTAADVAALDEISTHRGMGLTLPRGWKMNQMKAEQPVSTYPQFKREILSEISRILGVPYNVASGDSSSYSYASGRLDHRSYYKSLRVERSLVETTALDVLFARWWQEAVLVEGVLPDAVRELDAPDHEWRWDGDEHVDPTKEASAAENRLAIGLTSYVDECSRLGGDVATVHQKNAEALGLTIAEYRARLANKLFGPQMALGQPAPPARDDHDDEEKSRDER